MFRKSFHLLLLLLPMFAAPLGSSAAVEFERLNGSDLGMGIGARAMGFGGAYVSMADDASGVFWNPAGLVDLDRHELFFSMDLPADLSAAALVVKPAFWGLGQWNVAIGIGGVNRLSFKGDSGEGTWEGTPSYFLDVSMIDMEDDFSGTVDSQTRDARISLAMTVPKFRKLSLGVNFVYVDWVSDLCGTVGPDDASRTVAVEYNSFDLGLLYHLSETVRIGLMVKNGYGFSFVEKYNAFSLPRYVTLGISGGKGGTIFSLDCETIFGSFGGIAKRDAKFLVIRTGLEKEIWNYYRVRLGLIFPLVAEISTSGDLRKDMPWPKMGGALGIGAVFNRFSIDFAVYGDPAKTYVEQEPAFAATGTIAVKF